MHVEKTLYQRQITLNCRYFNAIYWIIHVAETLYQRQITLNCRYFNAIYWIIHVAGTLYQRRIYLNCRYFNAIFIGLYTFFKRHFNGNGLTLNFGSILTL